MTGDFAKIHRLLKLLQMVQSGTAGEAADIAQELGCTERTIFRDLNDL